MGPIPIIRSIDIFVLTFIVWTWNILESFSIWERLFCCIKIILKRKYDLYVTFYYTKNWIQNIIKKSWVKDEEIYKLKKDNDYKDYQIDKLEDKVDKLKELVNYLKKLWNKLIKFLHNKFFSFNVYDDLIEDMKDREILSGSDMDKINGNESIEKDDFEL